MVLVFSSTPTGSFQESSNPSAVVPSRVQGRKYPSSLCNQSCTECCGGTPYRRKKGSRSGDHWCVPCPPTTLPRAAGRHPVGGPNVGPSAEPALRPYPSDPKTKSSGTKTQVDRRGITSVSVPDTPSRNGNPFRLTVVSGVGCQIQFVSKV